jgi:hypothetical protein
LENGHQARVLVVLGFPFPVALTNMEQESRKSCMTTAGLLVKAQEIEDIINIGLMDDSDESWVVSHLLLWPYNSLPRSPIEAIDG